jgi:hypothetical protein
MEQKVVLSAVLVVLPCDYRVRWDEGFDGIEVRERRLPGEGLLPSNKGEQGQIDQTLT